MNDFLGKEIDQEPLLSICIPTYNQPEALAHTLDSLISQSMSGVEIVIRDDSPDSNSEELVKRYLSRLPIRYYHGEKNGVDRAVLFITQQARGKYIWWFGDDMMAEGAVEYMLKLITANPDISFVWVNSRTIGDGMLSLDMGHDRFFKDNNELLERVGDLLGYISATVFRRDLALNGIIHAERYVGSAFVTLFLVLYVLSQPGRYYYVQTPYVLGHPRPETGPHWYDPFQVFGVNFYKVVMDVEFQKKYDKKSIKKMLANNFSSIWRTILVQRAKGQRWGLGSDSPKIKTICSLYWKFPEFWIALPFLLAPNFVVIPAYKTYKFFFKKTRIRFRD